MPLACNRPDTAGGGGGGIAGMPARVDSGDGGLDPIGLLPRPPTELRRPRPAKGEAPTESDPLRSPIPSVVPLPFPLPQVRYATIFS